MESGPEHAAGFTYPIWPGSTQKDLQDVAGRNTSRAIFLLPSVTEIWTQIGGRNWTDGQSIDHGLLVITLCHVPPVCHSSPLAVKSWTDWNLAH